ncbi:MAG TPA: hypothetical protein VGF94_18050 [Kofleriaceae bacterium]|jgi:hypothetical protein
MLRLAIALVALAACGGKVTDKSTGAGSGSAIYAKKVAVSWGIRAAGSAKQDVFLQVTDDAGAQQSYPLGTFEGTCQVITPKPEMKAATAVACTSNDTGTELDAVIEGETIQGETVIIMRGDIKNGGAPDPMSRVEIQRVKAPPGAAVQVGA